MNFAYVGEFSVGATLTATASAMGAIDALVTASLPEVSAKLAGYLQLQIPSPSFDINAQIAATGVNLAASLSALGSMPGGAGLVTALTGSLSALLTAQAAIKAFNPSIALEIDTSIAAAASLNVSVSAGVSGPNLNMALIASKVIELEAIKASIEAQASLSASLAANLSAGGLRLYRFDGSIGELASIGAQLQTQALAAFGGAANAQIHLMFWLPTNAGCWASLQATVKTG